ncbi:unnamed protein product [Calicophoron daubneyi]|uniref:Eukaryotic translation initiation factor 2 subunit 2 n=1 Tax=Calicophoron daubneyi TaxID=300641 RepID=A0AAV2T4G7_CALDB
MMSEAAATEDVLDFGGKKKKKSKPVVDAQAAPEAGEVSDPLDFGTKKKKKTKPLVLDDVDTEKKETEKDDAKSKKKKSVVIDDVDQLAENLEQELYFTSKKKKKKPKAVDDENFATLDSTEPSADTLAKENVDSSGFTYDMLLTRVFTQLGALNPELASDQKRRLVMVPPQMARIGTKKTLFVNFATICRLLNRDQSHLTTYILAELGTQGSVDANGALLIRGRYQSKHMEPVLRNYCRNYVLCGTCQSSETELCKDSRLLFLHCHRCGSRITVKNVTSGFQAVTGRRAAIRAKTQ